MRKILFALLVAFMMVSPVRANQPSVSLNPDPLPHGESGIIEFSARPDNLWVEVRLEGAAGLLLQSWHHVSAGDTTFTPSSTPSWDGTGGADGLLRLVTFSKAGQKTVATGTFVYLP